MVQKKNLMEWAISLVIGSFAFPMTAIKTALSFVLLMVYTVGLVQGVTPRCNHFSLLDDKESVENVHHHEHHDHTEDEAADHAHIEHNGHFDASAFDLLACVLEDVSHSDYPSDGCECIPTMTNRTSSDWMTKLRMLAVLVPFAILPEVSTKTTYNFSPSRVMLSSPLLSDLPQRGPPSIS